MEANRVFDTGRITFTFSDVDGRIFASCRINPTDVTFYDRFVEVANFFQNRQPESSGPDEARKLNKELTERINYALGYDATAELFGEITPTTISPDGDMFATVVLDTIISKIKPELEQRSKATAAAIEKYAAKYRE